MDNQGSTRIPHYSHWNKQSSLLFFLRVNCLTKRVVLILVCWILLLRNLNSPENSHSLYLNVILVTSYGKSVSVYKLKTQIIHIPELQGLHTQTSPNWLLGEVINKSTPASFSLFLNQCLLSVCWFCFVLFSLDTLFHIQVSDLMFGYTMKDANTLFQILSPSGMWVMPLEAQSNMLWDQKLQNGMVSDITGGSWSWLWGGSNGMMICCVRFHAGGSVFQWAYR